jgi:hypothetical protein
MDTFLLIEILAVLACVGALGGFLSGLLGIGGGVIFVPGLYFAFDRSGFGGLETMHLSVGTSLAIVFLTGVISARSHHKRGSVDKATLLRWAPFLVTGVVLGGMIAGWVDGRLLTLIFSGVMLAMGVYMSLRRETADQAEPLRWLTRGVQKICAFVIGVLSALIGIGGGILAVPLMAHTGLTLRQAAGTGAAMGVAVAMPGMVMYMAQGFFHAGLVVPPLTLGFVNFVAAAIVAPISMLAAPWGVRAAHHYSRKVLKTALIVVLFLVAIKMFMTAL